MKKRIMATVGAGLFAAGLLTMPAAAAGNGIRTVMPEDLAVDSSSWYFYDDVNDTPSSTEVAGKYQLVAGAGHAPAGKGSLRFDNTGSERWNLATVQFNGTKIKDLRKVAFSTYQPSTNPGNPQYSVYLNFDVDFDGVPGNGGYQGRSVYVPRSNGTVTQNTWQQWNTTQDDSVWTWSRFANNGNQWKDGNTNANRTWKDIVTAFPNATVSADVGAGQLLFRSGEPYPDGFTGYLDKLVFKMKGDKKVGYDLEPSLAPTSEDDCKNGGWREFNDPDFDNQKQCVRYVQTGELPGGNHHWWHFWFGGHNWTPDWD